MSLEQLAKVTVDAGDLGIPTRDANAVVGDALSIVYYGVAIAAVIVIVYAGIMYATSQGDSGKVQAAKNAIIYAIVGLLAVAFAFVITNFIIGRF